jgi:hypothetical protein
MLLLRYARHAIDDAHHALMPQQGGKPSTGIETRKHRQSRAVAHPCANERIMFYSCAIAKASLNALIVICSSAQTPLPENNLILAGESLALMVSTLAWRSY